jgi:hypothetical protein
MARSQGIDLGLCHMKCWKNIDYNLVTMEKENNRKKTSHLFLSQVLRHLVIL